LRQSIVDVLEVKDRFYAITGSKEEGGLKNSSKKKKKEVSAPEAI